MEDSVHWIYVRNRIDALDGRVAVPVTGHVTTVTARPVSPPPPVAPPVPLPTPPPDPRTASAPPPPAPAPPLPDAFRPMFQPVAAPVHRTSEEWEALIGGNWVNKIGVFVAVIGIALLLNYAYTQLGAAGRVSLSLGA